MNTQPIASELSWAVLAKQKRDQDRKDGKITAPVQKPAPFVVTRLEEE